MMRLRLKIDYGLVKNEVLQNWGEEGSILLEI